MKESQRCYVCKERVDERGVTLWVGADAFQFVEPLERRGGYAAPVSLCGQCYDTYTAVENMKSVLEGVTNPPVRLGGYEIRAFDHGFQDIDDPDLFSQMVIDVHRTGRCQGTWTFGYFYEPDVVRISHQIPTMYPSDGSSPRVRRGSTLEVSADSWRAYPTGVMAALVDFDIAKDAAPMLQLPSSEDVDDIVSTEWKQFLALLDDQDSGKRERSDQYLDLCWGRGALTDTEVQIYREAWAHGRSVGRSHRRDDVGNEEFDEEDGSAVEDEARPDRQMTQQTVGGLSAWPHRVEATDDSGGA